MTIEKDPNETDDAVKHLRHAEQELAEAQEKGREAATEVSEAEAEIKKAIDEISNPREFKVEVLYNGVKKKFDVRPQETVKQLLEEAIREFGPLNNPHTLSLYKDGKELSDNQTLKEAGVEAHDALLLRPSTVKGGA
ncbi:MAG: hypothetical protein HY242_04340 [Afipia sp.]|nr:hypothetical protein [Afipia sp.]